MKVSKRAEYAIRAVLAIARRPAGKPVQTNDLSESEGIPAKFLEQILLSLKRANLLRSKRGAGGGYLLERAPSQISLRAILEFIDGPFDPLGTRGYDPAARQEQPGIHRCFEELRHLVEAHLDSYTVQDLLDLERAGDAMAFDI